MRSSVVTCAVVVVLAGAIGVSAADWPKWRGPNADGISPETGINKDWTAKPPKEVWRVPLTDDGFAGPSVADGKVLIIDHTGAEDVVRAIGLKDGQEAWRFAYADSPKGDNGCARSTPVVDDDRVYTVSRVGVVHCLTLKDGKKVWDVNLTKELGGRLPQWQAAWSPVVDGENLVVVPGAATGCVAALRKDTGKLVWKGGGSDRPGYATPVIASIGGKKQYVVFCATSLVGVSVSDGKLLWQLPWRTEYDVNAATPVVDGDTVFITSGYGHGCALVRVAGGHAQAVWQNKSIQSHFSSPVLVNGYIYGTTDPGRLVCLELKSGKEKWELRGFEKGGLVAVDGVLIVVDGGSGALRMVELSPTGPKELGRVNGLGGQSWTAPIVADGKLIVRNKRTLACLDLK